MSLTSCLKRAGDALAPEDRSAILLKARDLRASGLSADEAGRQAVSAQLEIVKAARLAAEEAAKPEEPKPAELELEAPTPETLRGRAYKKAEAEKADAAEQKRLADKAKADSQRDEFTLTGSDRAADVGAAAGQQDIFGAAQEEPAAQPAAEKKPTAKIDDFGEKLEGARKDYAAELKDAMDVDVAAAPLSKSWPEPDYQKMLDAGTDPFIVGFVRAARDEVPTKPQKSWKLKGWVASVTALREFSNDLLTGKITKDALLAEIRKAGSNLRNSLLGRVELYEAVGHGKSLKGITLSHNHYSLYRGQKDVNKWAIEQKAKATAYSNWPRELAVADTKQEAIDQFVAKFMAAEEVGTKATRKPDYIIWSKRGQPGAFIGKKIGREYIELKRMDDVVQARKFMADNTAELDAALEKYKETPYERKAENAPRVGDSHRNGAPVTPQIFADTFGFRGVQFGNYVEQGRRQSDLNEAFDGLMDMAAVLGVPPKALSLNGKLGLAFGARGKGGKNAPAAHYEPDNVVINLTKGGGPGSLAHEWWHSLDNYFGKESGAGGYGTGNPLGDKTRSAMKVAFDHVKAATQVKTLRQRAKELDKRKSKPYWDTPIELSARSFESYVIAKLQDQNAANDYLANVVSKEAWDGSEKRRADFFGQAAEETYPYPSLDELPAMRAAFDDFFQTVDTKTDDAGNVALFSIADTPWYSELGRQVDASKMNAAPADGWKQWLKGLPAKGVKPDEIEWSGINEWLDMQTGKVTRQQVQDYLSANGVQVQETVLDDVATGGWRDIDGELINASVERPTKYAQYTLPGGTNYREVLLTLPDKNGAQGEMRKQWAVYDANNDLVAVLPNEPTPERIALTERRGERIEERMVPAKQKNEAKGLYQSGHWDQPNVLAHIRVNDRTDADGKKVLFVEELQSDFGQDAKKRGFKYEPDPVERKRLADAARGKDDALEAAKSLYSKASGDADFWTEKMERMEKDSRTPTADLAEVTAKQRAAYEEVKRAREAVNKAQIELTDAERAMNMLGNPGGVPRAPFVANTDKWLALALKRVIKMAVDGGYDKVAFVTGEQSAERYDLSKQVGSIVAWAKSADGGREVTLNGIGGTKIAGLFVDKSGMVTSQNATLDNKPLADVVGKELAERIMEAQGNVTLEGADLKIGGEGMRSFYDKIVPAALKDVLKKVGGGATEKVKIGARGDRSWSDVVRDIGMTPAQWNALSESEQDAAQAKAGGEQPGFAITPAMREKAAGGMPLFKEADPLDATPEQADTAAYEPAGNSDHEAAQRFAARLNASQPRSNHVVLDAVAPRARSTSRRGRELQAVSTTAKRLFGHRVIFVKFQSKPLFNGAVDRMEPGVIFIRADAPIPMMSVLGHELMHKLRNEREDVYREFVRRISRVTKNRSEYGMKLEAAYKTHGRQLPQDWVEELHADIVGDFFTDPQFWRELAAEQPGLFKRVAQAILKFLDDVSEKLAGVRTFGTDKYITDIAAARAAVVDAMQQFSQNQTEPMADAVEGIRLSPATVAQGRIRRSIDELVQHAEDNAEWKDWYELHRQAVETAFGEDAELFQKILSATSQLQTVKGNVTMALRAYEKMLAGEPFTGFLPSVATNLMRIRNAQNLSGPKISEFERGNLGADDAIAVDRHIAQLLFNTSAPTAKQIAAAKTRIRKVAERLGWTPKQVQAALWAANQVRKGVDPKEVVSYDRILEQRADAIEAIRAAYGRGGRAAPGRAVAARAAEAGAAGAQLSIADSRAEALTAANANERRTAQDFLKSTGGVFDFNRLGETKQDRIRTVIDKSRPFWLGALTRDQIADVYGAEIPQIKDYDSLTRAMENQRSSMAQNAEALYEEWAKLPADQNDRLARIMLDATVAQVHPDQGQPPEDADRAARQTHARLRIAYKLLSPEAQAMYRKVRDHHAKTLDDLRDALLGRMDRLMANGSEKQLILADIRRRFDGYLGNGPYFPLSRFGDYIVVANRNDGERVVATYETAGEQAAAARALQADGFTVKLKTAKSYNRSQDGAAGKFIGDVLATIEKLDMDEAVINGEATDMKAQLLDEVNQLFIRALPDMSYRKHFTHRKNTPGFSADVMRGFASSAFHAASHIARLNHGDRMTMQLQEAFGAIESAPEGDFNQASQVLNEIAARHEKMLNPDTHPLSALATQVGFTMYLGLSPAAGLINMLQVPMVALPYIGAKHGFAKASAAMGKAYKDIMAAPAQRKSGFDAAESPKLSAEERQAIATLQDEGVIDLTQAHDLASATSRDMGNQARSKTGFAAARAMRIIGWTFHVPEVMNRQVTALMAYRLERDGGASNEAALEAAREAIKRTQFDYSSSNRARYMSGNVARVVLQFKQFSQNMTYFLSRAAYQALKGESPEVRKIARKQLLATFMVTGAMAGSMGLPGIGFFGGLIGALVSGLGDDDEPWDWKVEYRNALADTFGKDVAEVMAKGVPRALMPAWDISNRVGLADLWWRDGGREGQNPREAFASDMGNVLGPTAGTLLGWYTAADHMNRGNYSKAVEAIVPKFVRDPLKAAREASEGITSYAGEPLMETSLAEDIGRVMGFAPARASEMYEGRNAVMNAKTAIEEKRQSLVARAAKARMDRDTEAIAELQDEIAGFNGRNPAFRITGATIAKSVMTRRRNQANTEDGIMLPDSKDALRERGRFAATQ